MKTFQNYSDTDVLPLSSETGDKMIRLIASDLDGTLLNTRSEISDYSIQTLTEAIREGILFVPCSGRSARNIINKTKNIPGIRYVIGANGTDVINIENDEILFSSPMDKETVLSICRYVRDHGGFLEIYDHIDSYIQEGSEENFYESGIDFAVGSSILEAAIKLPDLIKAVEEDRIIICKMHITFPDPAQMEDLEARCLKKGDLLVTHPTYFNMEIFPKGSDKDKALAMIAEKEGIGQDEIMAIGDSSNDLTMIRYAGTGVAVSNAMPVLKEAADIITGSNDEDGAAAAVREVLEKQKVE